MSHADRFSRLLIAALLTLSAAICATAQNSNAAKQNTRGRDSSPTTEAPSVPVKAATDDARYGYEFKQPQFYINHIVIEHDAEGRGTVSFERKELDEPIVEPLELSAEAKGRILALWEALRFLDSDADYQAEKQFPHLGTMFLRMTRGGRTRTAEFNWTHDANAGALTTEYRRAADQAIFIFDINLARQHEPLNAPKLMDQLDTLLRRNGLSDPQQLVPLLRDIQTDERLPLIARNHAERILKKIEKQ